MIQNKNHARPPPPPPPHHHHHSIYEVSIFTTFARSSEILKKFEECLV